MSPLEALVIVVAGIGAGTMNTVVGSGTLITFPALLALGYPPVLANVSNTVGLTPGSVAGALGYRRELAGQRHRLTTLGAASVLGGFSGGLLLLVLPAEAFRAIVPVLIALALVLVVVQPRLQPWVVRRREREAGVGRAGGNPDDGVVLRAGVFATGVYGGYFGAAQGVLLVGLMGVLLTEDLQRVNAAKNVLAGLVNGTASVLFVGLSLSGGAVAGLEVQLDWAVAGLIALGAVLGGVLGARVGRRLPPAVLRGIIVVVGVLAIARVLTG